MWIVVAMAALISLSITSLLSTLFVIVMLNGYNSVPDGMIILYGGCAFGIGPVLALISGFASKKSMKLVQSLPGWQGLGLFL